MIKENAPVGAKFYAEIQGKVIYFILTKVGYRQIKDNLIVFYDSNVPIELIKPL